MVKMTIIIDEGLAMVGTNMQVLLLFDLTFVWSCIEKGLFHDGMEKAILKNIWYPYLLCIKVSS